MFRHFLARLRRKTKCYGKSKKNASVFRHTLNAQIQRWAVGYIKLTMPYPKRIAIIHPQGLLDSIPMLVSMINILSGNGFEVHVFTANGHNNENVMKNITVYTITNRSKSKRLSRWWNWINGWLFVLLSKEKSEHFDLLIGVDSLGLLLATFCSLLSGRKTAYCSLELQFRDESMSLPRRILKSAEIWCNKRTAFTVTQDKLRAKLLQKENGIRSSQTVLIPMSHLGPPMTEKTDFLHKRLGISNNKKLVLYIGSIAEFSCSVPLAKAAYSWKDEYVLIFHTRRILKKNDYEKQFLELVDNRKVFLSDIPVPLDELNELVCSADVGIALYEADLSNKNIYYMGMSSGKIGQYLKNGVPVISSDLPLINTMFKEYHCGLCVNSSEEVGGVLDSLFDNYQVYRNGTITCFNEKWRVSEKHRSDLLKKVMNA